MSSEELRSDYHTQARACDRVVAQCEVHTVAILREIEAAKPEFTVLSGWEDLVLSSLLPAAGGSMCAFANVAPGPNSTQESDLDTAARGPSSKAG
jgi:dihydrodipicolinate synthase/N-acetylneuraminate lyase